MQTELKKDIQLLNVALQEKPVFDVLNSVQTRRPPEELERLDREWRNLPENDPLLRQVMDNPITNVLDTVQEKNPRIVEILVTDRFGQLAASVPRSTDYDQSDETWWKQAYNRGEGRIYVPYIDLDESTDTWGVDLCLPIVQNGEVVGVAKAVVDLNQWLPTSVRDVSGSQATLLLIGEDGYILHSPDVLAGEAKPTEQRKSDWEQIVRVEPDGQWRETGEDMLEAFAPVRLPPEIDDIDVRMSHWVLLLKLPLEEARKGLTRLSLLMLLIGVACISALFLGGVLLIDRSVINRIQRIAQSARRVSGGELQHRADSSWSGTRLLGTDEIDDLARDFNNMVRRLQRSHRELTEANLLKENFIRIAGHELRTPVSYIVGMAKLMKDVRDPDRLAKAIDTMGFKASRLDEIIQAMFKLIPEQALSEGITYESVNLSELLEQVYLDMQPWIERRKQRLVIEPGEMVTVIQADKAKLRDVIENLVMNAIKFTPNEGVVKISVQRQLGGYVVIRIVDQGPGIPESDRPHIFEPFYSGSDVLKHSTGKSGYGKRGMGLGLAIVKHFVDLHGGSIDFATGPGGTTFNVHLPIEPPGGRRSQSAETP
jgi:signal transduction histidine kinase